MSLLQWGDLELDREKPFVKLRAATTKNRKGSIRTVHPAAVRAFKRVKERQPLTGPKDCVFAGMLPLPKVMKDDLQRAGIAFDPVERIDFHSLRHTLGTLLVSQPDIAPRTAMEVMRHGSIDLTMKTYTDAALLPTEAAILALPHFGGFEEVHTKSTLIRTHDSDAEGRKVSPPVAGSADGSLSQPSESEGLRGLLASLVAFCRELGGNAHYRDRTCDILRVKQALYR